MSHVIRAVLSSVSILVVTGCAAGNSTASPPPAAAASSPEDDAGQGASTAALPETRAPIPDAAPLAIPDPPRDSADSSEDAACGGSDIDLAAALHNKRCRAGRDAPPTPASASKDLKITLIPSAKTVAPGGHVDLALEIVNTSSAPIPLYFSGDLTLAAEARSAAGARLTPPAGNAPKNADPHCAQVECRLPSSHVVIAPGGKAHAQVGWDAVKTAWPATGPTTCCTIHVDPVAKGALPGGTYHVKVPLPYESTQGAPADPEIAIRVGK